MAAELFGFSIAETVLERLASGVYRELRSAWGVEEELEKLEKVLKTIKAVILDAEERQSYEKQIEVWLADLKDDLYDAEDILDEFEHEAQAKQVLKLPGTTGRKKLDDIAALKNNFHLNPRDESSRFMPKVRVATHSYVEPSDIIGREEDKKAMINLLHSSTDGGKISVIPIVGIGGLGKTALVKVVYNDKSVEERFPVRMWVCVSDDFDVRNLVVSIINAAGNDSTVDNDKLPMDRLQSILRRKIGDKKYLLVLDDVWNQEPMKWEQLMGLLKANVKDSKILVTTRSHRVAEIVGTVPEHELSGLSFDDCMVLFRRCAFKEEEYEKYPNLVKIGENIVKKCGGVPLAVKTLASLLFMNTNESGWKSIERSELWKLEQDEEDILPALRISYEQLPSHLKICFAYCSFFPKDFRYLSHELTYIWMAHGLVHSKNDNEEMEDIGLRYVKELGSRSFFQEFQEIHGFLTFKMHDLLHDLATSLIQHECCIATSATQHISKGVRHLLFADPNALPQGCSPLLQGLDGVRTLASYSSNEGQGLRSKSIIDLCVSKFQYLRYLGLSWCKIQTLPEAFGGLKHLRFLNLKISKIKRLPKSLYRLHNLQALWLWSCSEFQMLSSGIRYLVNLRSLQITTKQKRLPSGIGGLKSLRAMEIYHCLNLDYLFDMQRLTNLRSLYIESCPRLICLPPSIQHLPVLATLYIGDCAKLDLEMGEGKDWSKIAQIPKLSKLVVNVQACSTVPIDHYRV